MLINLIVIINFQFLVKNSFHLNKLKFSLLRISANRTDINNTISVTELTQINQMIHESIQHRPITFPGLIIELNEVFLNKNNIINNYNYY